MSAAAKRLAVGLAITVAGVVGIKYNPSDLAVSPTGLTTIIAHEAVVQQTYLDPVGIPTVCVGHTATAKMGEFKTLAQCHELLASDTKIAEAAVKRLVKVQITQEQYDALTSFTFNVGEGNLARSTLLRKLNSNDCLGAADEFPKWNRAKGKVLRGLTKRRADERAVFITGCT